jgi:Putative adhesin
MLYEIFKNNHSKTINMKKYLIVFLAGTMVLAVNAQEYNSKEPYMTKSLTSEAIQNAKVETTGGNIDVTGVDGEARIEVYVRAGNNRDRHLSKEDLKKRLEEEYELTVSAANHKLTAIAKQKHRFNNWNSSLSISFKLYVPHAVSADLTTSGGNIDLKALSGTQDFTTSGGNISVDQLSGNVRGKTSGGNITLSDSKDDIDLSTSGGNIDAKNSHGNIKLVTSGGSVSLLSLQGTIKASTSGGSVEGDAIEGELSAHTSGGNIDMKDLSCSLETSTSGGNIDVNMKSLGKYIKITNSGGSIDLQLPQDKGVDLKLYADRIQAGTLNNFKGDIEKTHIEGSLNGGGVPVTVHGGSGKINLTFK